MSIDHLYVFFGEMSVRSFAPFFIGLFAFDIESYELFVYFWRLILCQLQKFANSLSHSVDYLFVLSMVSFALQKLLSLISSHLVIFVSITLGDKSEKILLQHISECSAFVFLYRALLRLSIRMSLCGVGTWSVIFVIICLVSRRVSGTQQVHSKYLMTYIHILGWIQGLSQRAVVSFTISLTL